MQILTKVNISIKQLYNYDLLRHFNAIFQPENLGQILFIQFGHADDDDLHFVLWMLSSKNKTPRLLKATFFLSGALSVWKYDLK